MSKAILVIELPENLNKVIDEIRVDIKADLYGNDLLDWRNQALKPLPQKKKDYEELISHVDDYYEKGWNDCIDEILTMNEEIIEDNENRY